MIVDFDAGILKICDLGSAKKLNSNEKSISYVKIQVLHISNRFLSISRYAHVIIGK